MFSAHTETIAESTVFAMGQTDYHADMAAQAHLTDLTGAWYGKALVFNKTVQLSFFITSDTYGLSSLITCPEAGLTDIPVMETRLSRNIVRFEMDDFNATFCGIMDPQKHVITGAIYQGGYVFSFQLQK